MIHDNYIKNQFDANDLIEMITDYINIECNGIFMKAVNLPFNHKMFLKNLNKENSNYYRLLEIESLLKAYQLDIKTTIEKATWKPDNIADWLEMSELEFFLEGNFIWNKEHVSDKWNKKLSSFYKDSNQEIRERGQMFQVHCFEKLFYFHREITRLIGKPSAPLEGRGLTNLFFHSVVQEAFNNREFIIETLLDVINPNNISFSKTELIAKYDYPKENLFKIYRKAYNETMDNY